MTTSGRSRLRNLVAMTAIIGSAILPTARPDVPRSRSAVPRGPSRASLPSTRQREELLRELRALHPGNAEYEQTVLALFDVIALDAGEAEPGERTLQLVQSLSTGAATGRTQLHDIIFRVCGGPDLPPDPGRLQRITRVVRRLEDYFNGPADQSDEPGLPSGQILQFVPVVTDEMKSARTLYIRAIEN